MTTPFNFSFRQSDPATGEPVPLAIEVEMPSDVSAVEDAVEIVARHCFSGLAPCARTVFRFRVTLAEALSNAIVRGNREDQAKTVKVRAEVRPDSIRIAVEDQGDGFDPATTQELPLPDAHEAENGRGLTIIRHLADHVEFNDRGNTIWMTLPRS
jgi:serine/threonine-protein kinase RsbW